MIPGLAGRAHWIALGMQALVALGGGVWAGALAQSDTPWFVLLGAGVAAAGALGAQVLAGGFVLIVAPAVLEHTLRTARGHDPLRGAGPRFDFVGLAALLVMFACYAAMLLVGALGLWLLADVELLAALLRFAAVAAALGLIAPFTRRVVV